MTRTIIGKSYFLLRFGKSYLDMGTFGSLVSKH